MLIRLLIIVELPVEILLCLYLYRKEDYDLCSVCFSEMGVESDYIRIDRPLSFRHPMSFKGMHEQVCIFFVNFVFLVLSYCVVLKLIPFFDSIHGLYPQLYHISYERLADLSLIAASFWMSM